MLPKKVQGRVAAIIDGLANQPRPQGVEKLSGHDHAYRIRVGDYRIVYTIQDQVLIVEVIRVAQRGKVHRGL